jgi:D-3-phosphoglycerate dehydrogenase
MGQPYKLVLTSDRYNNDVDNLALEYQLLADNSDLEIELLTISGDDMEQVIAACADADVLLASTRESFTRDVLERLPTIKVLSRYGVGLDNVDLDAAAELGIVVTHYPAYCSPEVADHALSLILALNRRIVWLDRELKAGAWLRHGRATGEILHTRIEPLREQTLGIIGFGRIGRLVAERARVFGLTLLVHDPYVDPAGIPDYVTLVELNDLLARSDIVTLHCPLTPETRGMINAERLSLMKPTAYLVNTARGPIIDLEALATVLEAGGIAGAGLDVVDPEPLPADSPLYSMSNVILTPHSAYYSERSVDIVRRQTLLQALRVLRGQRPEVVANPAVLDRVRLAG